MSSNIFKLVKIVRSETPDQMGEAGIQNHEGMTLSPNPYEPTLR
jgi:hypothetical protein